MKRRDESCDERSVMCKGASCRRVQNRTLGVAQISICLSRNLMLLLLVVF